MSKRLARLLVEFQKAINLIYWCVDRFDQLSIDAAYAEREIKQIERQAESIIKGPEHPKEQEND